MTACNIRNTVYVALFSALIWLGAVLTVPLQPVPLTLQTLSVLCCGMVLGPQLAAASVVLYLLLGAVGFPVFSGFKGGVAILFGPTGGYLFGFILQAVVAGLFTRIMLPCSGRRRRVLVILTPTLTVFSVYLIGLPWLKFFKELTLSQAVTFGLLPFIVSDLIKCVAGSVIASILMTGYSRRMMKFHGAVTKSR